MKQKPLYFYIFNNGLLSNDGMSGSDQRVLHWSKIWKKKGQQITILTAEFGKKRFKKYKFNLKITDKSQLVNNILFTYLWRTLKTCCLIKKLPKLKKKSVIYSSSDLIVDSIPAILLKIKNPQAKLICGLHLLAPPLEISKNIKKYFTGHNLNLKIQQSHSDIAKYKFCPTVILKSAYFYFSQKFILWILKKYAYLILVSNHLDKKNLVTRGFSKKKLLVTYGGVDFKQIFLSKKQKKQYEAVWIGRLHPQKGIDDLFECWRLVIEKLPTAKLLIIGEKNLVQYFIQNKNYQKLKNNVDFASFLTGATLFKKIQTAKILLFPSIYESFGIAILEAMACALPVVAYDLAVYKKIWTQGMMRVKTGNVEALAKASLNLLTNDSKRKKLGKAAQKHSQQFTWEKSANKILCALSPASSA
ncbi:MAG: glycosyltransferase family 4 protein [Candidatus Woesebacteria bacterium]|jgi:glycosyltransferase involved in cell wall biosynthesis